MSHYYVPDSTCLVRVGCKLLLFSCTFMVSDTSFSPFLLAEAREPVPHSATQLWEPNRLPDSKVEQFLVVARYVKLGGDLEGEALLRVTGHPHPIIL